MNTAQILSDLKSGYETINCMGDFLTHFVESYPHSSHVREARTRKYLLANYREAISNGLESIDDLIGATAREIWIDDVLHRRKKLNLDSSIIQSEYEMRHGSRDLKNNCYARNALSVLIVSTFIFRALSRLKIYSKFPSRTEIIKKSFHF